MEETLIAERELVDGKWHSIAYSKDRRISVDTGPDDQSSEHDGEHFFRPICVADILPSGDVYNYHKYCGYCSHRMGSLGEVKAYCPKCGRGIAHYVFAMGVEKFPRPWGGSMPETWPASQ